MGGLAQKGTRKRARLALVLVLVLAVLLGGRGGNRGRAVWWLGCRALRLGCGLVPFGPRRSVLSTNGKHPRRRFPGATLPALVWAAAFPLALGCAVPLWRGPDLGRVGGAACCLWHMCGGLGFNLSK